MKSRIALIGAAGLLAVVMLGGCGKKSESQKAAADQSSADAAAVVNGSVISRQELEMAVKLREQADPRAPADPSQILNQLINTTVLEQQAIKEGIEDRPDIKLRLKAMRENLLVTTLLREKVAGFKITNDELKKAYDAQVAAMPPYEYKARHILTKTKAEAEAVIKKLEKGANFAELAKKDSIAPSAPQGGELGWFNPESMVPPFSEAVKKLKKGQYTKEPVHTQFGWHVIELENSRKMPVPSFDESKERVRNFIANQRLTQYITDMRNKAEVKVVNATLPSADTNGKDDSGDKQEDTKDSDSK
jgi:peptidyl-prolyl cis-trans isomerase C